MDEFCLLEQTFATYCRFFEGLTLSRSALQLIFANNVKGAIGMLLSKNDPELAWVITNKLISISHSLTTLQCEARLLMLAFKYHDWDKLRNNHMLKKKKK